MAAAAPIAMGIGAAFQVVGAIKRADAESDAANYNAQIAERNAGLVKQQSAEEERIFRIQTRKQIGEMRANYGASGLQLTGSVADVLADSAAAAELDALKIRHAGDLKAAGLNMEADMYRQRGSSAKDTGYLNAAGYLFGGAGNVTSKLPFGSSGGGASVFGAGSGSFSSYAPFSKAPGPYAPGGY